MSTTTTPEGERERLMAQVSEVVSDAEEDIGFNPDETWPQDAIVKITDWADHRALGIIGWRQRATSGAVYTVTIEFQQGPDD